MDNLQPWGEHNCRFIFYLPIFISSKGLIEIAQGVIGDNL